MGGKEELVGSVGRVLHIISSCFLFETVPYFSPHKIYHNYIITVTPSPLNAGIPLFKYFLIFPLTFLKHKK